MIVSPGVSPRPSLNVDRLGHDHRVPSLVSPGVSPRPSLNDGVGVHDGGTSNPVSPGVSPRPSLNAVTVHTHTASLTSVAGG